MFIELTEVETNQKININFNNVDFYKDGILRNKKKKYSCSYISMPNRYDLCVEETMKEIKEKINESNSRK